MGWGPLGFVRMWMLGVWIAGMCVMDVVGAGDGIVVVGLVEIGV